MANILGGRKRGGIAKVKVSEMACQKEPIGVGYSLQCVTAEICEYRSGEM